MFLVRAGAVIQIEVPRSKRGYHDWIGWQPYTTKEDKLYEKEEVWDLMALENGRSIPMWAERNIREHGKIVIQRAGKFAMVNPRDIQYLD